jgi:hypothetical protein
MVKTRSVPPGARRLRTYAELEGYISDFVQGRYPFIWIVGRPGVAKTESLKAAVRGHAHLYRKGGQLTPAALYIDLYACRGQPVILDDAEHLLDVKVGAKLISSLGDTTPAKLLTYSSTSRVLGEVPQSFHTTSPLCIIANRGTTHEDIQSRSVCLHFDPTNLEIHRAVGKWYWDQEVHDWLGTHLFRLSPVDARWYVVAAKDKEAKRDWRQIILKSHSQKRAECVVQDLEEDPSCPSREDKARRFGEVMGDGKGASRPTYFRLRKRLEEQNRLIPETVPRIRLSKNKPPSLPSLMELDAMGGALPAPPEPEPTQLDVPLRDGFVRPIRGDETRRPPAPPAPLDDNLPWESRRPPDDDGGE